MDFTGEGEKKHPNFEWKVSIDHFHLSCLHNEEQNMFLQIKHSIKREIQGFVPTVTMWKPSHLQMQSILPSKNVTL